ncbi:MAG: haloalkane dehalogenase [Gammaproteobacteria bacterium]|nr:haloalkane dehalogenase [Gammaproteobacteria bacterium]
MKDVLETRKTRVFGSDMAYVETGEGRPIVLLHGNPTSKYLWRNVIPHIAALGRCIAPDLIGMGESDKLAQSGPHRYSFFEHYRYLREFLYQVGISEDVVFVIHDWGSALGFHWACEHSDVVRGICFTEAIVQPLTWQDWPEAATGVFQGFRSENGESMAIGRNLFVERVLPGSVVNKMSAETLDVYRTPYQNANEDRRPTLSWPREIPIDGEPQGVVDVVTRYAAWLQTAQLPKLFINAEPGAILVGRQREACRAWPRLKEITVTASHFVPEDAPHEIGKALADWLQSECT